MVHPSLLVSVVMVLTSQNSYSNETIILDSHLDQGKTYKKNTSTTLELDTVAQESATQELDLLAKGKEKMKQNQNQEALPYFQKFRKKNPDRVDAWIYEIKTLNKLGRSQESNLLKEELIDKKPSLKGSSLLENL